MAIRNIRNNLRLVSIPQSCNSTFHFSFFSNTPPSPNTPTSNSATLLSPPRISFGCSTLCFPYHPFAGSSTRRSIVDNGHSPFNLNLHFHTRVYFCTRTCTPYWSRPLATSEQVSQIIALIREDGDDLVTKLNSMNVSLSDESVVDIFQILARDRVSALQFFDWLKVSDPDICCDPDIGLDKTSSMECVKKIMAVFNEVGGVYQSFGVQLLIEMFGLSGSFEIAEFVIRTSGRKMKNYHVLMKIMCKRGDCKRVRDLVEEMERSDCDMNASTYNLLLSCLCKSGKIDEAWQVLEDMEKNYGLTDVHSFGILINTFCKRHQFDLVLKLLDKMTLKGIEPSILTHAAIIKSYFESGKHEEAHVYVIGSTDKLSYSSNANYSLLATLHLKNGNVLLASKVLSEMMDKGLKPNFSAYKKIRTHLEKKAEKDLSMELSRRYLSLIEK
ncbi:pentatricopeptide repeat-containing protein At1g22960, mitochondrial-like isoform X2 [Vigna radiata var. radiata]|uniref:Pentatricopeptide repeat-containing protein At1g22960, mitochondrial-like isoform X2 n=1 Tax=Vigna radiata var. radiata TaxID=3916 RepID=A0A3Q0EYG1_VIGRR|nr:pentatricopeptide repeat-containing protein At1g22960, mitochondrial-like isoform X2 [Vigna radiata var. radiata]